MTESNERLAYHEYRVLVRGRPLEWGCSRWFTVVCEGVTCARHGYTRTEQCGIIDPGIQSYNMVSQSEHNSSHQTEDIVQVHVCSYHWRSGPVQHCYCHFRDSSIDQWLFHSSLLDFCGNCRHFLWSGLMNWGSCNSVVTVRYVSVGLIRSFIG